MTLPILASLIVLTGIFLHNTKIQIHTNIQQNASYDTRHEINIALLHNKTELRVTVQHVSTCI